MAVEIATNGAPWAVDFLDRAFNGGPPVRKLEVGDDGVPTLTDAQVGKTSSDLVGFWGAAPVAQPSSTGETAGFTAGAGSAVLDDSTFTGNVGSTAYTVGDLVKHLKTAGIIKS